MRVKLRHANKSYFPPLLPAYFCLNFYHYYHDFTTTLIASTTVVNTCGGLANVIVAVDDCGWRGLRCCGWACQEPCDSWRGSISRPAWSSTLCC